MLRVAVSGGFDFLHTGHLRMMKQAAKLGELIVILNSDDWLTRKKGAPLLCFEDRKEIIESYSFVSKVVKALDDDGTVCASLEVLKPDIFCNGGDRVVGNTPEEKLCQKLGITTVYNVGGGKIRSSSELVAEFVEKTRK